MKKNNFILLPALALFALLSCAQPQDYKPVSPVTEQVQPGEELIAEQIAACRMGGGRLKNVIIMIADGWGDNHIAAVNYFQYGGLNKQPYQRFPVQVSMSTYSIDGSYDGALAWLDFDYVAEGYTDSAAAATTMSTGHKTYNNAIGLDKNKQPLKHLFELAEESGRSTGVVTSVEWSHATPAGFTAHNETRHNYEEIAKEMIYESAVDVLMGAGNPWFDHNGNPVAAPVTDKYVGGLSTWNELKTGTAGSDADGDGENDPWTLIETREEFQQMAQGDTPARVVGTARVLYTLQQGREQDDFIETVPTLAEMTAAALNVLDNNEQGLFLMIEGGAVDWASHGNQSDRTIEELLSFNQAVEEVLAWVEQNSNWGETMVIVTGDHETGYLTGPGSGKDENGTSTWNPIENRGYGTVPGMEWHSGNHTNSLVPFFAKGRYSRVYQLLGYQNFDPVRGGYMDNTDISKVLSFIINYNL